MADTTKTYKVPAENLEKLQERIAEAQALDIGIQMADALAHSHTKGLIHRDVKPDNVLVSVSGRIVVSDFGLAIDDRAGDPRLLEMVGGAGSLGRGGMQDLGSLGGPSSMGAALNAAGVVVGAVVSVV